MRRRRRRRRRLFCHPPPLLHPRPATPGPGPPAPHPARLARRGACACGHVVAWRNRGRHDRGRGDRAGAKKVEREGGASRDGAGGPAWALHPPPPPPPSRRGPDARARRTAHPFSLTRSLPSPPSLPLPPALPPSLPPSLACRPARPPSSAPRSPGASPSCWASRTSWCPSRARPPCWAAPCLPSSAGRPRCTPSPGPTREREREMEEEAGGLCVFGEE